MNSQILIQLDIWHRKMDHVDDPLIIEISQNESSLKILINSF